MVYRIETMYWRVKGGLGSQFYTYRKRQSAVAKAVALVGVSEQVAIIRNYPSSGWLHTSESHRVARVSPKHDASHAICNRGTGEKDKAIVVGDVESVDRAVCRAFDHVYGKEKVDV